LHENALAESKNSLEFREKVMSFMDASVQDQARKQTLLQKLSYRVASLLKNLEKLLIEESEQWFESENVLDTVSPMSPHHKKPNESNFLGGHHRDHTLKGSKLFSSSSSKIL
jgi:flagellar motility protein MotE (MotC chaperone)